MMDTGWALASFENGFAPFPSNVYYFHIVPCSRTSLPTLIEMKQ